ncbi:MAG: hypothetical protein ACJ8AO_14885 [Gemmatimonadaceae bacterium]
MRGRTLVVALAALAVGACSTDVTQIPVAPSLDAGGGGSPHFIRADATLNADATLTVAFKEAGLADNQLIDYVLSANGTATWVCVNNGGANPSAQNKTTVHGPVIATGSFASGKNGQVNASLTVSPPGSDIACPPGQSLALASDSFADVRVTDTTNSEFIDLSGIFASGCLLPAVRGACD